MKIDAVARVVVTLEIGATGHWGDSCTVRQIQDQASSQVVARLRKILKDADMVLVGEPRVKIITHEEDK